MNKEELLVLGLSESQAEEILNKHNQSVLGLSSKKDELLDELKKIKGSKGSLDSELERLRQIEQKFNEEENVRMISDQESKRNYESALELQKETISKRTKELEMEVSSKDKILRTLLIDNGLDNELDVTGVAPEFKRAVKRLLSEQLTVKDGHAVTEDGKSISDMVKAWSETDEGSAFIKPQNSGGGGQGSPSGHNSGAIGKKYSEMTLDEKGQLFLKNPSEYYRLQKQGT